MDGLIIDEFVSTSLQFLGRAWRTMSVSERNLAGGGHPHSCHRWQCDELGICGWAGEAGGERGPA